MQKKKIIISMGDPAGIGAEVIIKALALDKVRRSANFVVFGNQNILEKTAKKLGMPFVFKVTHDKTPKFGPTPVLLEADRLGKAPLLPGRWSVRTGRASLAYILAAVNLCKKGFADAMVTAPVCKKAMHKAGCKYPGHTEFIADLTGAEKVVMMLIGGGLRVALVTTHASVAVLPQLVTRGEICATLLVTNRELKQSFRLRNPRIGVLGLNPHAGESGIIGDEEKQHIIPALRIARKKGVKHLVGPISADTAFHRMLAGEFDVLVAMYHDQGLGPLKTVAFEEGVNVTLGLPIVRTSVDHGTAFDIAGKGQASEKSMVAAIATAVQMAQNRMLE